ncbi:MAG TPA: WbuC family cupin fold metalloprotein [Bryobacteraceae bacterium]|jgi:cupin fold WbuC family metalloprotein
MGIIRIAKRAVCVKGGDNRKMGKETPRGVSLISGALFDSVEARALQSPRRRMNYNFHSSAEDNPHRFLNVLLKGTYIRPHRHADPPKSESFVVLEGAADVILFDDDGAVTARYSLGAESPEGRLWGIDIAPGVWHTILPRTARAVCFEVKPGPWRPASDKEFAPWAPAEDDPSAAEYGNGLLNGA